MIIDLHQLHFKHAYVLNEGEVDRQKAQKEGSSESTSYTILTNALQVAQSLNDQDKINNDYPSTFIHSLMETVYNVEDNNPVMCPIEIFLIDGKMYDYCYNRGRNGSYFGNIFKNDT